jgi:hypothetical protein
MSEKPRRIDPKNLTAQLRYRAAGNPPGTEPHSAISNCYPGLEFDFRNVWRRTFVGLVMHEADNIVVSAEDPAYSHLVQHRLLTVDGDPLVGNVSGPRLPGADPIPLGTIANPHGVTFFEWSNSLARILTKAGSRVECVFTGAVAVAPEPIPTTTTPVIKVELEIRRFFDREVRADGVLAQRAVIARDAVAPGELTQSLCSPWQNDYRECGCYYWAASRPDYVNVEPDGKGGSMGHDWMQAARTPRTPKQYIVDDRQDSRLVTYDDLFSDWEHALRFEIEGKDTE